MIDKLELLLALARERHFGRAAEACGWLWHDLIVWDQNEQRSLVLLGYPTRFYTNQNCSFLVVLRNPAG